ncbi:MAG: hypothetical protein NT134_00720 [Chloroflexi bacterium]|nr:hypothetical protein [Chloroflexota bacterium]
MSTRIISLDERFLAYYDKLRDELNTAYTYYEISKTLREIKSTRRAEFSEALTFLSSTLDATLFSTVMSINRFIDSHRDSLHLDVFFEFIRNNLNLFSATAYKKRLLDKGRDSEDCEHWVKLHKDITMEMVEQDKKKVESLPVHNLKVWRDKKLAHIEKDLVIKSVDVMKNFPVTVQEIDTVISTLHEILDRYRIAYDGTQWILGLPPTRHQIEYIMNAILFYRQSGRNRK